MTNVLSRLRNCLRHRGRRLDLSFGVDTFGVLPVHDLQLEGGSAADANGYEPTPPFVLPPILRGLPVRHDEYSFVDLGSGMGRALFMAMEFPFRRVIGVEFSPVLHAKAKDNARRYHSATRKCKQLELVRMDAVRFEIPAEPLVIYMYNPFRGAAMDSVMRNIEASLEDDPRDLFLIYLKPVLDERVSQTYGLNKMVSTRLYSIYRSAFPATACTGKF